MTGAGLETSNPEGIAAMKGMVRSPVMVLVLSFVTCGLYALFWMYAVRLELRNYLEDSTISPGMELFLAIICFPFVYVWYYKMGRDIARAQEKAGLAPKDQSVLYLVLAFFGLALVSQYIAQDDLNAVWQSNPAATE